MAQQSSEGVWRAIAVPRVEARDLFSRAAGGDREAFERLLQPYRLPVQRFVARQLGSHDAEDVLQETWIGAWGALAGLKQPGSLKTWLYAIAVHKCRTHLAERIRTRQHAIGVEALDELTAPERHSQVDARHDVRRVLAELPKEQREVLELYYFAELSLKEIGEVLGQNLNTVKYRFYRAHEVAAERMGS